MIKCLISFLMLSASCVVLGANLGNYGQKFPVIEEDLRQVFARRLEHMERRGELKRLEQQVVTRVREQVLRPQALGLTTTERPRTFLVDPSITVSRDVVLPGGRVIAKKGMHLNPFALRTFSKTLVFFNQDNPKEVAWVLQHYANHLAIKLILTGGNIQEASRLLGRVYFDWQGHLSERLQLQHVPSVVKQEGLFWKVQEIGIPS